MLSSLFRKLAAVTAVGVSFKMGKGARLNRLALRMRRGDFLTIGDNSIVDASLRTDRSPASIHIGERTFIGGGSKLIAAQKISVGDDVLISWDVTIVDHDSHALSFNLRKNDVLAWGRGEKDWTHVPIAPVHISNKAWIGFGASILKGVNVGEGAVVAAQSIVTRDVPPWSVVAGSPAKVIRMLTPEG